MGCVEPSRGREELTGHSSDDKPMSTYTSSSAETKLAIPKSRAPVIPSGPEYEVDESGEEGTAQAPRPTREADGTLVFEGRWKGVFKPNVTPQEMFDGGAFGGGFFTSVPSFRPTLLITLTPGVEIHTPKS